MTLRSLAIVLAVAVAGTATAAPLRKKPPPELNPKKSKKQLAVEKHEWMAQYYLRKANDYEGAIKEYKAILALEPDNVAATLALSSMYRVQKKDKDAVAALTKLTKKNPKSLEGWIALAELQAELNDDKGFKVSLDKATALAPTEPQVYWLAFERAQKKVRDGDVAAKQDVLDAAKKLKMFERYKGSPMYRQVERAVVELSGDPIELTIYDAKTAYSTAFDTGMMGRINASMATARRGFEECVKTQPKNEECHYYLGMVHASVKASDAYDLKKALGELALAPSMPLAWVEAAKIHRAQDKNSDARAALEKAVKLDPELALAHIELGILDKVDGKVDAAVTRFVAAMDADPWGPTAERALKELIKVKPTHPRVQQGVLRGKGTDIFSTDRYKSVVELVERELGGVEKDAPEQKVLEEIVRKLAEAGGVKEQLVVQLVATKQVNAFAMPDGHIYVTRGLIELMQKKQPNRKIDANHDALGHILGHEVAHVTKRHTLKTDVFQEAAKDASRRLDAAVVTHVTRLHEIEADREGIVLAFLAGFHPRGGIEFMEIMGQEMEVPKHLDHPTFEERVEFLTDYWTNDVRYAFTSFKLGVAALDKGTRLEQTDMENAVKAYDEAVEHFKKFRTTLPTLKEAMNDLGIAYTKIGVLAMAKDSPLGRWQTRFSLERDSAVKYVGLAREEEKVSTRGTEKTRIPWQLREAVSQFKEALAVDEDYSKARLNLALAYTAANQLDNAKDALGKIAAKRGVVEGDIELVRGIVLAETKDYAKAQASFEKAIQSQQAKRAASYNLARTLELAGKKDEAKRAYQQYVKLYPGGPWAKAAEAAASKL